jgi:nucleoside-diphosphate-sugar epimerase
MRIAVTGICGFAGSRLARRLLQSLDGAVMSGVN